MESRPKRRHGNVWADSSKDRGRRKEAVGRISFHLQVRIRQFRFATVFRVKKARLSACALRLMRAWLQIHPAHACSMRRKIHRLTPFPSRNVERSRNISNLSDRVDRLLFRRAAVPLHPLFVMPSEVEESLTVNDFLALTS